MRKFTRITAVFFLLITLANTVFAGEVTPTPVPWQIPMEDGYPAVIDRFTDPKAYPEFSFEEDAEILHLWLANTRDSDSILLQYGDENWMIDCCDERWAPRVMTMLEFLQVKRIDKLINSHPHHDHLAGLHRIDDVAEFAELAIGFPEDINEHMIKAMTSCGLRDIRVTHFEDGSRLILGDDVFLDIWMKCDETYEMNDRSAVIRLLYGDRTALFTGDIETAGQKKLLESVDRELLKADILKYPHHGKQRTLEDFYTAVNPSFVLVTNNAITGDAPYYLGCKHVPVAYSISAYVHLMTDGKHWVAERVRP
ncbi:MAG TPA: MBL fold metallo-hydrolase [Methanocorpusculum sp.]|nr:MBL fold metallo-hydrolase [Methanocorpusculum sp.]